MKYFNVRARYSDFDRKVSGGSSSTQTIKNFRAVKQITALELFPLEYHLGEKHVKAHLPKCGRKFLSMMYAHYCEYKGKVFYVAKEKVFEILIKSRVLVDATYFRE